MRNGFLKIATLVALSCGAVAGAQAGTMRITEWMYNGGGTGGIGEFVEFTNVGTTATDMTGWSFDDNSNVAGSQSLSSFGIVNPGESVILTDDTEAAFRTRWNLGANVKIIGGNINNLGRSDEINLYNSLNTREDFLTYNDQGSGSVAGPRTSVVSASIALANLGANNASLAVLSTSSDSYNSYSTALSEVGNPGSYAPATAAATAVPVPAAAWLLMSGVGVLGAMRRRRKAD